MLKQTLSSVLVCSWLFSQYSSAQDLTQQNIDMGTLYAAPSNPDDLLEYNERTYMEQLIDNNVTATTTGDGGLFGTGWFEDQNTTYSIDSWTATTGCLDPSASNGGDGSWGGTSGGSCANIGTNGDGAIRFGYNKTVVSQTQDVINDALKIAGINVVGYLWQWKVKNYNANDTSANQVNNQDPLYVRVIVRDNDGNVLDEREWDYSYSISGWEQKNGMHWYDPFLMGDEVDSLTLEVEGKDAGYWAGYWGPEFREAGIYSIFVYKEPIDCSDPLNDARCPGYATALQEQQEAMLAEQLAIAEMTNDPGTVDQINEAPRIEETAKETESERFAEEVVVEVVEEPKVVEEVVEVIEETIIQTIAPATVTESKSAPTKIRVNPLEVAQGAVADADAVAGNAVTSAIGSATQSSEEGTSFVLDQITQSVNESASMDQQLTESVQAASDLRNQENLSELEQTLESTEATVAAALESVEDANQVSIDTTNNLIEQVRTAPIATVEQSEQTTGMLSDEKFIEQQLAALDIPDNVLQLEIIVEDYSSEAVSDTLNNIISKLTSPSFELKIQEAEEELNEPMSTSAEADLVAKAYAGSDDEDARSALLGYNPLFSQYQQLQMADADFYKPKEIYPNQKNHDNPNSRFFNGASDEKHNALVRMQYDNR